MSNSHTNVYENTTSTPSHNKITPLPEKKDFIYWAERVEKRQDQYAETKAEVDHAIIEFPDQACINFIGDLHVGAPETHHERIRQEAEAIINTPHSYVVALGDWVDAFFFNPAQFDQIEQTPEQVEYSNALLEYYAQHDRLLVAYQGDHDGWIRKYGGNAHADFSHKYGAYFMHGVGYITAKVKDQEYKITGAHRLPGHSMYNKTHPQNRAEKFGSARGSHVVVAGHTHQKGYSSQAVTEFGGVGRKVHYISIGAYKATDGYAKKLGFGKQTPEEMYGSAIILHKNQHRIEYYDDIITANKIHTLEMNQHL